MKYDFTNVTRDYVNQLVNSDEFKKYVLEESYEDEWKDECLHIEECEYRITITYVVDEETCFKQTFYLTK